MFKILQPSFTRLIKVKHQYFTKINQTNISNNKLLLYKTQRIHSMELLK